VAFHYVGFIEPPEPISYWTSLLYAFRSTISLTDSQVTLTAWGAFFQALLRITGPVLLGLTLLALRWRVTVSDRMWVHCQVRLDGGPALGRSWTLGDTGRILATQGRSTLPPAAHQ
jgi:hypothetical protein